MAVERATEKVQVRLVDGKDAEVHIYTAIPFRKSQMIKSKLFQGMKINSSKAKEDEFEIEGDKAALIMSDIAEAIWADKNYSLDDVEDSSFEGVIQERLNKFLGSTKYRAKIEHNQSS